MEVEWIDGVEEEGLIEDGGSMEKEEKGWENVLGRIMTCQFPNKIGWEGRLKKKG